jgi:GNAT superfamily N-acetyltransferase
MPSPALREVINNTLQTEHILSILESDPIWSAYALADLDPEHDAYSDWHSLGESVLLRYTGFVPPILFAQGEIGQINTILAKIPKGDYQISFPEDLIESLPAFVSIRKRIPMWRMCFTPKPITQPAGINVHSLGVEDLAQIEQLYENQHDAPDGYHPRQLQLGPFAGVWESGMLVATAGVHVLSKSQKLAAVGNIFTHPDWRRHGYAEACTASVLLTLIKIGLETIVLNVGQKNQKAKRLYERMGFKIHCPFYEGDIKITNAA